MQARIAAITPRDYTRMGPPIRYLTRQVLAGAARHRLLVSLSDGRPDDFGDDYRSQYGIEDSRQALREARQRIGNPTVPSKAYEPPSSGANFAFGPWSP